LGEPEDLLAAASDALKAARLLMANECHPDSVSRAYYAMLYGARAALASRGIATKTHGGTLQRFGEAFVIPGLVPEELAKAFGKAMFLRQRADYAATVRPGKDDAETVLRDAERFLEAVRALLARE